MADETLQHALSRIAKASAGKLSFRVRSVREIGEELGLELAASKNPVYEFEVALAGGSFKSLAYTLIIDGSKRPATRVEALGRGLAAGHGQLFDLNPFLLIFDYVGEQFMAVSAIALFGAFAQEVAVRPQVKSETATFSLSPNFAKHTISMYAKAPASSIWHSDLSAGSLTLKRLVDGLTQVRSETKSRSMEVPEIVEAIVARINSVESTAASPTSLAIVPAAELEVPTLKIAPRVWRMILMAVRSSPAVILVGPPGTGKTALLRRIVQEVAGNPLLVGLSNPLQAPLWATPDESWTARELVGGETIVGGEIKFRPGWVLRAIRENRWLVLDEVNRADMDRIFGGLLTWLAGGGGTVSLGVASTAQDAPHVELGWNNGIPECATEGIDAQGELMGEEGYVRYLAGESWRLLGTYNALDAQRVFRFGAALGRRFVRVPIPALEPELFEQALAEHADGLDSWWLMGINELYAAHYASEITQLGPALFLGMCRYLRVAADELGVTPETASGPAAETGSASGDSITRNEAMSSALAEAYVVNIGTWLAHLEPRDLEGLQERVLASAVLTREEWSWITTMIRTLA